MNKQQILEALEGLKELTNDNGKRTIDAVKAGIHFLQEEAQVAQPEPPRRFEPVPEPAPVPEPDPEPAKEVFHPLNVTKRKKGAKK